MTRVLWFSRHEMSPEQKAALGSCVITQVNGTMSNIHAPFEAEINGTPTTVESFKSMVKDFDVLAIVAPIQLQQQILGIAGDRPVIMTENDRVFDGGGKVTFKFKRWFRLVEIKIVTEDYGNISE